MTRNVRNFWVGATIDGRQNRLESGPAGKYGGFRESIYIRDNGSISTAFSIEGRYIHDSDELEIVVRKSETGEELKVTTIAGREK